MYACNRVSHSCTGKTLISKEQILGIRVHDLFLVFVKRYIQSTPSPDNWRHMKAVSFFLDYECSLAAKSMIRMMVGQTAIV